MLGRVINFSVCYESGIGAHPDSEKRGAGGWGGISPEIKQN
jgi:hypothetical protein